MTTSKSKSWIYLITQYLTGQGLINLVNILVGLVLLRILSIEEFALYTLSIVLLQIAALGSDMGLSQAINSMGARISGKRKLLGSLYSAACFYGYRLYVISACVAIILSIFILFGRGWSLTNSIASLIIILLIVLIQVTVNFRKSVLNINHDVKGLFHVGMVEAGAKLLFVPLCIIWPHAAVALLGSLAGACAGKLMIVYHCRSKLDEEQPVVAGQKEDLKKFIIPLMPVIIYYALQGQLSVFLLGIYGYTSSIAEVGALGRLGQIVALLMMLNGFLIQPVFARINQRSEFITKGAIVFFSIIGFSFICMVGVYLVPEWWLYILGKNYYGLKNELPIAVITALFTLLGGTLYTIVISRNSTHGQSWYIALGLSGQVLFLSAYGVHSTFDALLLSLIPVVGYAFVQAVLLGKVIYCWKDA